MSAVKKKNGRPVRLLVVDDHEQIRSAMQRALTFEGYEVVSVASGTRALEMLATTVFDLVLLDVNLPDIGGFDVLQRMRETREWSILPVIMVTGSVDSQSVMRGKQLNASDYLVKPYRIADLLGRVERCLAMAPLTPVVMAPADTPLENENAPPEGEAPEKNRAFD